MQEEIKEVVEGRELILESFKDLIFIEEGHKYFLNGKPLPSVSVVTHKFCAYPFDEQEQAENYAKRHGQSLRAHGGGSCCGAEGLWQR